MNRSSKTKTRKAFISIALVLALAITGALAFLTARDSAENKFTVGNVDIDLTEPNWDENAAKNIVSGQVIAKDPTITNTGRNDAYVYMMVEIPKAIETDIVSTDESGNEVTTTEANYPLFSFAANEGWTLIDSQVGTDIDAYDYYVYGYNTALTPGNAATLFDEVAFANVTSDFVDTYAGENDDLSLDINVTGYAIQSDYYNNEATDATTAWTLYINQNDWKWPDKKYAGLSTISFVAENGEVVHTETAAVGTPVEMYFEPSLAKTGYTFDWVNEATSEVAYSGMPMPEEDTTLTATYTDTGYTADETNGLLKFRITGSNADGYTATCLGVNTTTITDWVVPASITVTGNGRMNSSDSFKYGLTCDEAYSISYQPYNGTVDPVKGTYEIPVTAVEIASDTPKHIIIPDSAESIIITGCYSLQDLTVPYGTTNLYMSNANGGDSANYALKEINFPNSLVSINSGAFQGFRNIGKITLPPSLKTVPEKCFYNCTSLTTVVTSSDISRDAFNGCTSLSDLTLNEGVTNIGEHAFRNCTSLSNITLPNSISFIYNGAFYPCNVNFQKTFNYLGTAEDWTKVEAEDIYPYESLTLNINGQLATEITSVAIPDGVGEIYRCKFRGWQSLESVTIPNSVTTIGGYAFYGCSELTSVTIPDSVTEIGVSAFIDTKIKEVSIPSGCTVGVNAFPSTCTVTYR